MGRLWSLSYDKQFKEKLQFLIQNSPPRSKFFRMLKKELSAIGRWRNRPRGKPGFKR